LMMMMMMMIANLYSTLRKNAFNALV